MSDNKFIQRLKGKQTPKSVVEVQNDKLVAPFTGVPNSTDVVGAIVDDKDSSVMVAKGAQNWKLDGSSLVAASSLSGDGADYTGEFNASGSGLWINATYSLPATIFNAGTKWVLKLCGKNLLTTSGETIDFTLVVKVGNTHITSKTFTVAEGANVFCRQLVIDFSESEQAVIKAQSGDSLTVQLLCADANASATIYNGMTVLTALQRKVDSDAVASDTRNFDELEEDFDDLKSDYDQFVIDTQTALDCKVNIDGTSIMTAPLKFVAGSMRGAVGPYLNGVGFWKINSGGTITQIATLSDSQFLPITTNAINFGSSSRKWKDLYLAGKVYVATINNGADLSVPNKTGTLATTADVELAANSGSQLYSTGVWYAKMYSASTVPTGAQYDGTNYADFSQVDADNNPVIKIYTGASGAWTLTDTITPPAEYNGYIWVTSKIWDIAEQTDQQGGQVLWDHMHQTFTPYPHIVKADTLPDQTGNSGKYLTTNGTSASWGAFPTINYSVNGGNYTAGTGSYAITRFSLMLQKADGTWEKPTDTSANYSQATNKTVNTNGFLLNQILYYNYTGGVSGGQLTGLNRVYSKHATVPMSYSTNCGATPGWALGTWIYLVGTLGADGLFYLDTTQWWSDALPNTNDGKLYIRLGPVSSSTGDTVALLEDRPIFYHDGTGIQEYHPDKTVWIEYGVTPFATIKTLWDSGKVVMCKYGKQEYTCTNYIPGATEYFYFTCVETYVSVRYLRVSSADAWIKGSQANQPVLVSGTNIKTINGQSVLGSGDLTVSGGAGQSIDAEIVGALTVNGSEVSGFSNVDYLETPTSFGLSDANSFEISGAFTTGTSVTSDMFKKEKSSGNGNFTISVYNSLLSIYITAPDLTQQSISGITTLSTNTKYYFKLEYDGTNYVLSLSTDGVNYTQEASAVASVLITGNIETYALGKCNPLYPLGALHLNNWCVKKDGIIVWQGMDAPGLHQRVAKGHEVIAFQAPTAGNNYTWYRKYADGWVEQGGDRLSAASGTDINVVYPVAFSDEHYTLTIGLITTKDDAIGLQWAGAKSRTSTGCVIRVDNIIFKSWYACGIAAS